MQCRCPLCGGITQVPAEMLDFLVRCDRCSQLLRPAKAVRADGGEGLKAEPAGVGRVREHTSQGAGIAELLCPPRSPRMSPAAPEPPAMCVVEQVAEMEAAEETGSPDELQALAQIASAKAARPVFRRRKSSGLGAAIATGIVLALLVGVGVVFMALKSAGAIPPGATVAKGATAKPAMSATPATPPRHDPPAAPQRDYNGELFTHVKPR